MLNTTIIIPVRLVSSSAINSRLNIWLVVSIYIIESVVIYIFDGIELFFEYDNLSCLLCVVKMHLKPAHTYIQRSEKHIIVFALVGIIQNFIILWNFIGWKIIHTYTHPCTYRTWFRRQKSLMIRLQLIGERYIGEPRARIVGYQYRISRPH